MAPPAAPYIAPEAVAALRNKVWGSVVLPEEDQQWKEATRTWLLGSPGQAPKPAIAVRPRGAMDVQAALAFAKENGLPVSVKSGGHHPNLLGLADGGLLLDMSLMRGVHVDPRNRTAIAEGGALLGDIDRATAVYGLAVPLGHAPVTGMGLVLGGGMGVGMHIFGPTCQHVIGATVVLADGRVVNVDQDNDPELLWGLKGAGAALGVVTSVTFRLFDVSKAYAGMMMLVDDPQRSNWKTIARWMVDVGSHHPKYSNNLIRGTLPDGTPALVLMIAHVGEESVEEKAAFLAPLRKLGPMVDTVQEGGYLGMQFALFDLLKGATPHYEIWTSGQLSRGQMSDGFYDNYAQLLTDLPEPLKAHTIWLFDMWRPAGADTVGSTDIGPTSLGASTADFGWLGVLTYEDPAAQEEAKAFSARMKASLNTATDDQSGLYANLVSSTKADMTDARLTARVGGAANLQRLRALKTRVDPDNVFSSHPLPGL